MTVSSTATRWPYVGDNSTVNFAYNNKIFLSADLDVYLDGVLQTETTHYTVSGAGNEGGGTVTFVTPPPTASSVIIVRDMALTQETDIPNGGILLSNALENEFDRSRIADQQINEKAERALQYPVTDQATKKYDAGGLVIENLADGVSANDAVNKGQMDVAVTAAAGGVLPETILQTVATLAELQAFNGITGQSVRVNGRATAGDGYQGTFIIYAPTASIIARAAVDVENGIYVLLDNGNYAARSFGMLPVEASWFDAVGDDSTDDDAAIQGFFAVIKNLQAPATADGIYRITSTIDLRGYFSKFRASGMTRTKFRMVTNNVPIMKIGATSATGSSEHGASIGDFRCEYITAQDNAKTLANGMEFYYVRNSELSNIEIQNPYRGWYAPSTPADNHFFSNTVDNIKIRLASGEYFAISSGSGAGNTGNSIRNIYCSGNRSDVASATCSQVYKFERMSDSDISQINAEWLTCTRALTFNRCSPRVSGVHFEGLSSSANNGAFINVIGSIVDMTLRVKTCNFSGGDPETKATGSIANFALIQIEADAGTRTESTVTVKGSNAGCTPSTTNTRFAISNAGWVLPLALDIPQWFDSDLILTEAERGTHDGANGSAVLVDSTKSWTTNQYIGSQVINLTDGSYSTLTANGTSSATGVLANGTDNDWDSGDIYAIQTTGLAKTNFVTAPSTPHMPILRQFNNIHFSPIVRANNSVGTGGAGTILWAELEDTNNCYDAATGKFKAPSTGDYQLDFSAQTTSNADIRFENTAGTEQSAKRAFFGGTGTYVNGSMTFKLTRGESVYVHGYAATTANANTKLSVKLLG